MHMVVEKQLNHYFLLGKILFLDILFFFQLLFRYAEIFNARRKQKFDGTTQASCSL